MTSFRAIAATLMLVSATAIASAAVGVGDAIEFSYETLDGKTVSTKDLQGRMIIVEHWATWCGPCVKQVPHLKKLYQEYTPRGVALIGMSHDSGTAVVEKFIKANGMGWPQVMGKAARGGPDWGVSGIPHAFIISPEGKLLWRGHPASMDEPLEQAMKDHPPRPKKNSSPAAELTATLKAANTAIDQKDTVALVEAIAALADASFEDRAAQARLRALARRVTSPAVDQAQLSEAAAKNEAAAAKIEKLKALVADVAGAKPDAPAATRTSPALVKVRMDKADAAREKGEHIEAYMLYKWIADRAEGDEQQPVAAERVAAYEADTAFMAEWKKAQAAEAARTLLTTARSYADADKKDLAITTYQQIIDEYPDTAEARQAKDALAKLKR